MISRYLLSIMLLATTMVSARRRDVLRSPRTMSPKGTNQANTNARGRSRSRSQLGHDDVRVEERYAYGGGKGGVGPDDVRVEEPYAYGGGKGGKGGKMKSAKTKSMKMKSSKASSNAPSCAPTTTLTVGTTTAPIVPPTPTPVSSNIRGVVAPVALNGGSEWGDPESYQAKAITWLESDTFSASLPDAKIQQRYALASIYYATFAVKTIYTVVEPRGWIDSTGWVTDTDECSWFGLTCNVNGEVEKVVLVSSDSACLMVYDEQQYNLNTTSLCNFSPPIVLQELGQQRPQSWHPLSPLLISTETQSTTLVMKAMHGWGR